QIATYTELADKHFWHPLEVGLNAGHVHDLTVLTRTPHGMKWNIRRIAKNGARSYPSQRRPQCNSNPCGIGMCRFKLGCILEDARKLGGGARAPRPPEKKLSLPFHMMGAEDPELIPDTDVEWR